MKTYLFEGQTTALSSISHNGGGNFGISTKLRREKFIQPDFSVEEIPVISGNALRGMLRDRAMLHMCKMLGYGVDEENGQVRGLTLPAFHFLFSGGALTSEGGKAIDIERMRTLRKSIPLVGVFGGAYGNAILPGKTKIGKLIPICQETNHLLPAVYRRESAPSIWEYLQEEMYTRKDDAKNEHLRPLLASAERPELEGPTEDALIPDPADDPPKKEQHTQMMYFIETFCAGTPFYWRITLDDVTDIEFEAFLCGLAQFSRMPYIGGKSAVGLGEISVNFDRWLSIDSRVQAESQEISVPLGVLYQQHLQEHGAEIRELLGKME
jgi:hypothetical protein